MKRVAIILACALLGGCATVTVSRDGATMVNIENSGWYLLNFIPIASGNPARPNSCTTRLFSKTVTLENNVKMLDKVIRDEGAVAVRDINSFTIDEHVLLILLKRHSYHTSAQLLMKEDMVDAKAEGVSTILPKEF
ncbi:MAG: hypothetical protein J5727_09610 [Kiritimatiellae bacterium]|nr:hypothetical protein [Kiritimatiellia bacterium]MCR5838576.1 hypothetical protein [Kiritimatiellia bacterium]